MGVIQRQGIKNFISTYVGFIIGFINLIVIQPIFLTTEELGLTRLLYSFSLLIAMIVPMGIGNATIRYFPQFKDTGQKHHGYFMFMIGFVLAGYLLASGLLYLFRDFVMDQYRTQSPLFNEFFNYVFPLIFVLSFVAVLNVYCNANYKSTIPGYINDIVVRMMTIGLITVYFNKWLTLHQFIAAYVGIYMVQMIFVTIYIFTFDKITFKIDWKVFKEKNVLHLVKYGLLLWLAGVASLGLKYFDAVMIGKFMPIGFVGIYTIAAFIPTLIEAPLNALEKIAAPRISFAWKEQNIEEIKVIYHKSTLYMFLLGGLMFLLVNINIKTLLSFLPDDYSQGNVVVLLISIGTLFNMATGMNAPILFNSDKYRYGAFSLILLAVLILLLQYVLIPLFGLEGAALATCLASLVYNAILFYYVKRFFNLQPFTKNNLLTFLLIVVLAVTGYFLPTVTNPYWDILYKSAIISVLYGVITYKLNLVPELHRYLKLKK